MDNQNNETKKPEPHVTILGGEVGGTGEPRISRAECREERRVLRNGRPCCDGGSWIGGIILVLIGAVLVLNNYGVVSWEVWRAMAVFWPVFLIIFGIRLLLGRNAVSRIVTGALALIFVLFIILLGLSEVNSPVLAALHLPQWALNIIKAAK